MYIVHYFPVNILHDPSRGHFILLLTFGIVTGTPERFEN